MTLTQAQNLAQTLLASPYNANVEVLQEPLTPGSYYVLATKPGATITSVQMTAIANAVVPSVPAVVAQTNQVRFI